MSKENELDRMEREAFNAFKELRERHRMEMEPVIKRLQDIRNIRPLANVAIDGSLEFPILMGIGQQAPSTP